MIIIKHLYNYGNVLNEDQLSEKVKKAIKNTCGETYRPYLHMLVSELPKEFQEHLREYNHAIYSSCINTNQNFLSFLRQDFLTRFDIIRGKGPKEFIDGIIRIAIVELGMYKDNANSTHDIDAFKIDVLFVHNSPEESKMFNANLNGLDFTQFHRKIYDARKKANADIRGKLITLTANNDYDIIPIESYEDATKYGRYTSWCVTHGEGNYDSYTSGGRRFYFCLKKGFESVRAIAGDSAPLDEYGLSMISVLVDIEGEPNYITTRWNHEHDGENNTNLRTPEQLQQVTGINFYKSFPPYTREELHKMGIVTFDEARERLEAGEDFRDIFHEVRQLDNSGFFVVGLNDKLNFINTDGKLISDKWFDVCYGFQDGFAPVRLNDKLNFINTDGKLISDKWFDGCGGFQEGFASVSIDDRWNFINTDGKLISDKWFDRCYGFQEGFAKVRLNDRWNFINTDGKLISDKWFDRSRG